jgi:hypothetical protein
VIEIVATNNEALNFVQKCRADPWFFATNCVFTRDSVDKNTPIKAFPSHYEYLRLYFKLWQTSKFIAVPKSRRMFMTWANITLYLWDTMFFIGRHNAFVSKKEEDSDDLVRRARFIIENIPKNLIPPEYLPAYKDTYCRLSFPGLDSVIEGFPSGADQLRQYTFSGILADEIAFWDNAEKMYSASIPTLEGGGRFTAISSASPGFFQRMVYDKMDFTAGRAEGV